MNNKYTKTTPWRRERAKSCNFWPCDLYKTRFIQFSFIPPVKMPSALAKKNEALPRLPKVLIAIIQDYVKELQLAEHLTAIIGPEPLLSLTDQHLRNLYRDILEHEKDA